MCNSSVAQLFATGGGGGGKTRKCTDRRFFYFYVTYMRERAPQK